MNFNKELFNEFIEIRTEQIRRANDIAEMSNPEIFKEQGVVFVPNLLSGELLKFVGIHAYNIVRYYGNLEDSQVINSPSLYGDYVMENLLDFLLPKMEENTGLKLLPTYTYMRVYKKGDKLKKHVDRPSCEISLSLTLKRNRSEDIWPIQINNLKGSSFGSVFMEEGDGAIYRGCDCEHWRDEFTQGTKLAQVFLHYVDADGPNKEWHHDKNESKHFAKYT